jgi:uncharacterized protein with NRDE domain
MCITFLFINPGDDSVKYKIILINNRDELYNRKTLKADLKKSENLTQIYGEDVATAVEGTWLAISKRDDTIRIGNLLNVPGEVVIGRKEDLRGRGPISLNFVRSESAIEDFNETLCNVCTEYNSFNFLSVEIKSTDIKTYFISNASKSYEKLKAQIVGASNSPIDSPLQKVIEGKKKFNSIIDEFKHKSKRDLVDALVDLLKCEEKFYPDQELLKRRGATDASNFSSIHVKHNKFYGSRTRTIVLIDQENNVEYIEQTMENDDPDNAIWTETILTM